MKTISIKRSEIKKDWWLADASDQVLGRFASQVSQVLRGKHKPNFTPHMDMGDFVIIINAKKIRVTGNKETSKIYFSHSGFPGGSKEISLASMRKSSPERILRNAIKGMLPHNKLGRSILKHLKIYKGSDHPHLAQKPMDLEFNI